MVLSGIKRGEVLLIVLPGRGPWTEPPPELGLDFAWERAS